MTNMTTAAEQADYYLVWAFLEGVPAGLTPVPCMDHDGLHQYFGRRMTAAQAHAMHGPGQGVAHVVGEFRSAAPCRPNSGPGGHFTNGWPAPLPLTPMEVVALRARHALVP